MSPLLALTWSVALVVGAGAFGSTRGLGLFIAGFALLLCLKQRGVRGMAMAVKLTVPFAVPLVVVHCFLNPTFQVEERMFGVIPVRPSGLLFAALIALRILVLTVVVVIWREVDGERLLYGAVRARLPLGLVVIVAVAAANLRMLASRIRLVYVAQQARGVAAGPSLLAKARALPRIVVPVIASTITEGHARGVVMTNRGLGEARLPARAESERVTLSDVAWTLCGIATLVGAWVLR